MGDAAESTESVPRPAAEASDSVQRRRATLLARRGQERPTEFTDRGRLIHGPTVPGGSTPWPRSDPLTAAERDELGQLIASARLSRESVNFPFNLRARSWDSVEQVVLATEDHRGQRGVGWKIGAASVEVRAAESIPEPSPGLIFEGTIFRSPATMPADYFINYRLCECEFGFEVNRDFAPRQDPYFEDEVAAGIECIFPTIEIGDSVFDDWYSLSGYFGAMYDNNGGAALVVGERFTEWERLALPESTIDLYVNDHFIKTGKGAAAMGNPLTSLTWMINWLRQHDRTLEAGEVVSTGTCTAHCFVAQGDHVAADFGPFGLVEVTFE